MQQENTYLATLAKRSMLFGRTGIDNLSAFEHGVIPDEISRLSRAGVISARKRHFILLNLNG